MPCNEWNEAHTPCSPVKPYMATFTSFYVLLIHLPFSPETRSCGKPLLSYYSPVVSPHSKQRARTAQPGKKIWEWLLLLLLRLLLLLLLPWLGCCFCFCSDCCWCAAAAAFRGDQAVCHRCCCSCRGSGHRALLLLLLLRRWAFVAGTVTQYACGEHVPSLFHLQHISI